MHLMRRMWPLPSLYHLSWQQLQTPATTGSLFWRKHFDKCRVRTTNLASSGTSVISQRRYSPPKFCIPVFEKYNGKGCPIAHLKAYCGDLAQFQPDERLLIRLFQKSLSGPVLKWFTSLDMASIKTWNDLSQAFLGQYSFNLDLGPKHADIVAIKQNPGEPSREYVGR